MFSCVIALVSKGMPLAMFMRTAFVQFVICQSAWIRMRTLSVRAGITILTFYERAATIC